METLVLCWILFMGSYQYVHRIDFDNDDYNIGSIQ
jgi:hypothetical protein